MRTGEARNTFAIIKKEEDVKTLVNNVLKNTFVLEIIHPFPGYYYGGVKTKNDFPGDLFLILKKKPSTEFFYRALTNAKKYCSFGLNAVMAELKIYNNTYAAIRIKNVSDYSIITEIQEIFTAEGFQFARPKRIEAKAFIKIFKFINLAVKEDVYHNLDDANFVFFPIDKEINWKLFEKTTVKIKNSVGSLKFDVALAVFFRKGYLEDAVRVYCKDFSDEQVHKIRTMYLDELKHF
ncbi:MAG: hypothetical protein KAG64_00725 [Bacteroidales bacterium]|nr:hypothetical protein [Bacteroidales bacterium]